MRLLSILFLGLFSFIFAAPPPPHHAPPPPHHGTQMAPYHNPQAAPPLPHATSGYYTYPATPHYAPYHQPPHIKGVMHEIFERASFDKKREALRLEFQEKQAIERTREGFRGRIKALELDKKLLEVDLQEARTLGDNNRINSILSAISQQEYKITQERSNERINISQMEADMIRKINSVLGY